VSWIAVLITVYILLGLRARQLRGSTHLIILAVTAVTLGFVLLRPVAAP
jgi:uncharacterized membrane protein YkgB